MTIQPITNQSWHQSRDVCLQGAADRDKEVRRRNDAADGRWGKGAGLRQSNGPRGVEALGREGNREEGEESQGGRGESERVGKYGKRVGRWERRGDVISSN